jgi:hypothetical protein
MEKNNSDSKSSILKPAKEFFTFDPEEEILIDCRVRTDQMFAGRCISGKNLCGQRCSIPLTYATKFRKNTDGTISVEGGERKMKLTQIPEKQEKWFNAMVEPEKCFVKIRDCRLEGTAIVGSIANNLHRLYSKNKSVTILLELSHIFKKDGSIIIKTSNTQWKIVSFFQDHETMFRKRYLNQNLEI